MFVCFRKKHVVKNAVFFDIFHIERCNVARFCVPTHETGERSLWMLEPTNFLEELRRVI